MVFLHVWPVKQPTIMAVAICQKWLDTSALAYMCAFLLLHKWTVHVPVHFPSPSCTSKSVMIHSSVSAMVSEKRRSGEDAIKEVMAA